MDWFSVIVTGGSGTASRNASAHRHRRADAAPLDGILPADTVVTIWVYPNSFELFRRIRDLLYQRGIEVAGRPLPFGMPIAASQEGTASRAQ